MQNPMNEQIERLNYEALLPAAQVTEGAEMVLRDDVILTSSQSFPSPDSTHACLLKATPETIDALLDEVTAYFQDKGLPTTIYVSPACTPTDIPDRLLKRGFVENEYKESWVLLEKLEDFRFQPFNEQVVLHRVTPDSVTEFAETFLAAFEQPVEFAPALAELLKPSASLPDTFHYLGKVGEENIGTISLIRYQDYGIIGSGGIVPAHRKSKMVAALFFAAFTAAQNHKIRGLFGQTELGGRAEQLLLPNNFRRLFVRRLFTLE